MSDSDTYSELELKLVGLDMGTMFLDDLKVLKQAHIEQIRSDCFEAKRYYSL
jgi:hypothetical protein